MSKTNEMSISGKKLVASEANGNVPQVELPEPFDRIKAVAKVTASSALNSAKVVAAYNAGSDVDLVASTQVMIEHQREVKAGDMSRAECMLMNQAVALQSMFVDLALRAKRETSFSNMQVMTGLALKTQSACRATLQALGDLKYPRQATFVRQANIAHGPQQVNNDDGPASPRTQLNQSVKNKLLDGVNDGSSYMVNGTTPTSAGKDPELATLEPVHRPKKQKG
jgi:hypothetical protein